MSKEMYVSSSPHETKVAVLEDDQLVEVHFERDTDVGLVGGIYKGRVSRVLPGMQSAFVDVGLDRDAFLYVSDFYEDQDEYDKVFEEAESRATKFTAQEAQTVAVPAPPSATPPPSAASQPTEQLASPAVSVTPITPPSAAAPGSPRAAIPPSTEGNGTQEWRPFDQRRGRHRRHRGRPGFNQNRFAERKFTTPPPAAEPSSGFEYSAGRIAGQIPSGPVHNDFIC